MKELIIRLVLSILGFTIIYLIGSFISASFNIINWSDGNRISTGVIGGFIIFAIMTYPFENITE